MCVQFEKMQDVKNHLSTAKTNLFHVTCQWKIFFWNFFASVWNKLSTYKWKQLFLEWSFERCRCSLTRNTCCTSHYFIRLISTFLVKPGSWELLEHKQCKRLTLSPTGPSTGALCCEDFEWKLSCIFVRSKRNHSHSPKFQMCNWRNQKISFSLSFRKANLRKFEQDLTIFI